MSRKIDLHGLNQEQAIGVITNEIYSFKNNKYQESIIFITGKGTKTMEFLVKEAADENNLNWTKIHSGCFELY